MDTTIQSSNSLQLHRRAAVPHPFASQSITSRCCFAIWKLPSPAIHMNKTPGIMQWAPARLFVVRFDRERTLLPRPLTRSNERSQGSMERKLLKGHCSILPRPALVLRTQPVAHRSSTVSAVPARTARPCVRVRRPRPSRFRPPASRPPLPKHLRRSV